MHSNSVQHTTATPTNAMNINLPCSNSVSPKQFNQLALATIREIIKQRRRLIKMGTSKVHLYEHNKKAILTFESYTWTDPTKTAHWIAKHEQDFREIIPGKNLKLQAQYNEVITLVNQFKPVNNEN